MLLGAFDHLRPVGHVPEDSTEWRRFRYLLLRYVEGIAPGKIADDLALSERQARRLHQEAVGIVADHLWERHVSLLRSRSTSRMAAEATGGLAEPESADEDGLGVENELARIGTYHGDARTDLDETLAAVLETIAPLAARQAGGVEVSLPPDLPALVVERSMLRQILLLSLAFALETDVGRLVHLTARSLSPEEVAVDITTAGQGEPEPPVGRVTPDWADARLDMATRLVELQGGTVERSGDAIGRPCLRIRLPAVRPTTVLVIDDNPGVARLFRRYLRGTNYRVIEASTGQGALDLARQARPDVITLDVVLPSQDGWEILQRLRRDERTRDTPIIVCSILPERSLALALGVEDFLPKPVSQQSLLAALERCLQRDLASGPGPPSDSASPRRRPGHRSG